MAAGRWYPFDDLNLHDASVHAWVFEPAEDHPGQLQIDIDYIEEWIPNSPEPGRFLFRVAPMTLVFDHAWDVVLTMDTSGGSLGLNIELVHREWISDQYAAWHMIGNLFVLDFKATRCRGLVRDEAVLTASQRLRADSRERHPFVVGA